MSTTAVAPFGRALTPVEAALDVLIGLISPLNAAEVPLEAALGRVLAEDVVAAHPLPGCDNSAMDGFAVRAEDCAWPPATLPIAGESRAGAAPPVHRAGMATRISTGAPIPRGADSVVPVEDTDPQGDVVTVRVVVSCGDNVRRGGEDARPGELMVRRGQRLRAADIGVIAAAGRAAVRVHRRPRVAVVAGGDELVPAGSVPMAHQVVDSNTPLLEAAIREAGGEPLPAVHAGDEVEAVSDTLRAAAENSDLIVSSAGVSVGGHDHVRAAVERLGSVAVWGVAMRPGKPLLMGDIGGTPLLGMPGNPVSCAVCFQVFARPALLALQGAAAPFEARVAVRVAESVDTPRALETYLRVTLLPGDDALPMARLSGGQGSAMLRPLAAADALLVVPAGSDRLEAGAIAAALPLR